MREQDFQADYYETLGVSPDASFDEIRREYHRLLVAWNSHPSPERDAADAKSRIELAWEILSDPNLRVEYDRWYAPLAEESDRQDRIGRRTSSFSVHARHCRIEVCFPSNCYKCGQQWNRCRADLSLGEDQPQCPANKCFGFKIDPGRHKFGRILWYVASGCALLFVFLAVDRCDTIDRQHATFLISSEEAQAARFGVFALLIAGAILVYLLFALTKWMVGGTRNSEWWRIWHSGDTKSFVTKTVESSGNRTWQQESRLHDVLKNPDVSPSLVSTLIETGASVNSTTMSGETPLDVAVSSRVSSDVLKILVDAGAVSYQLQSLLEDALRAKASPDQIQLLIEAGAPVNGRNDFGDTPLDNAITANADFGTLRILVESGAIASDSPTMLHDYLWKENAVPEGVALLIRAGAHVNARDDTGDLPIEIAVSRNLSSSILMALVESGADASGSSMILRESLHGHNQSPHNLKLLIDAGAPVNSRDENGFAPIDIAFEWELEDEVLWVLIEAGADLSRSTGILHKMLRDENQSIERVNLLISNGARIDALDDEGYSPLDIAFINCLNHEIIWALIDAGADISNSSDLLHRVLRNPYVKSVHVEMLTNMGIEVNAKDYLWSTPLEIAVERDLSPEIFRVLIDAGAHWSSYPNTVQDKLSSTND